MTTQAELFKKLKDRAASSQPDGDKPKLPEFIKFRKEGDVIQGTVIETFVTKVWDPANKTAAKDKNGDEIPQLNVTLEVKTGGKIKEDGIERATNEGEIVRMSFANDLLWKLGSALEELGLDELPVGAAVAAKWTGAYVTPAGVVTRAREHDVRVKVAE